MPRKYDITPFMELGVRLLRAPREDAWAETLARSLQENSWFSDDYIRMAIHSIATDMLTPQALQTWIQTYTEILPPEPKSVGIIMAGNLPLVGFADLMYVLVAGHRAWIKPSSKDRVWIEYVCNELKQIEPAYLIEPLDGRTPDALIATGNDHTRRYFQQHYSSIPTLLRGSRYSLALLSGQETPTQLDALAEDIFAYCGLGCRNVSRLFIPRDYPLESLLNRLQRHPVRHPKYLNAYRQTKATLTLSGQAFRDGGFFLLCEHPAPVQAVCVLEYIRYDRLEEASRWIAEQEDHIQCIVSDTALQHPRQVAFGQAQHPRPEDYADGVDVMNFLLRL